MFLLLFLFLFSCFYLVNSNFSVYFPNTLDDDLGTKSFVVLKRSRVSFVYIKTFFLGKTPITEKLLERKRMLRFFLRLLTKKKNISIFFNENTKLAKPINLHNVFLSPFHHRYVIEKKCVDGIK